MTENVPPIPTDPERGEPAEREDAPTTEGGGDDMGLRPTAPGNAEATPAEEEAAPADTPEEPTPAETEDTPES